MAQQRSAPRSHAPTHHTEAEAALIGAVLLSTELLNDPQIRALRPSHFDAGLHYDRVWQAIQEMKAADTPLTPYAVAEQTGEPTLLPDLTMLLVHPDLMASADTDNHRQNLAAWATDIARRAQARDRDTALLAAVQRSWSDEELLARLAEIKDYTVTERTGTSKIISIVELLRERLPEQRWAVPDFIPEGLTILAGKPKMGKSWLCLNLAMAVACGGVALGKVAVEQGEVLYLALEDNKRRLQQRVAQLIDRDAQHYTGFHVATAWPRIQDGGAQELDDWLTNHPAARLVIVDTYAKVRDQRKANADLYDYDYQQAGKLKHLADKHGVAIVLVHHFNKGGAEDFMEAVSGSSGVTGAADAVLGLVRERGKGDAVLKGAGRDVADFEKAIVFDSQLCQWTIEGDASEYLKTQERTAIARLLREHAPDALSPKEIAESLGKPYTAIKMLLSRMARDGEVKVIGRGLYLSREESYHSYHVTSVTSVTSVTTPVGQGPRTPDGNSNSGKVTPLANAVTIAGPGESRAEGRKVTEVTEVTGVTGDTRACANSVLDVLAPHQQPAPDAAPHATPPALPYAARTADADAGVTASAGGVILPRPTLSFGQRVQLKRDAGVGYMEAVKAVEAENHARQSQEEA